MRHYYNENDPQAAAWLRELVADGQLPEGDVDDRSIVDVQPGDLAGYRQCHFFAGIGGAALAVQRSEWRDRAVWTGSVPCQPFSLAGRRKGSDDERHLWPAFFRLIEACRPDVVVGEQVASPAVVGRADGRVRETDGPAWLDVVFDQLEAADYTCGALVAPVCSVGAPHLRQRLYWVAHDDMAGCDRVGAARVHDQGSRGYDTCGRGADGKLADTDRTGPQGRRVGGNSAGQRAVGQDGVAGKLADTSGTGSGRDAGELHGQADAKRGVGPLEVRSVDNEPVNHGADKRLGAEVVDWRDCDWVFCSDQRWRPTQPAPAEMVARLSRGVVPRGGPGIPLAAKGEEEARTMRLRGYGNAVNVEMMRTFLNSAHDALGSRS